MTDKNQTSSNLFMEKLKVLTEFIGIKSLILPPDKNYPTEQLVLSLNEEETIALQIMFITDSFEDVMKEEVEDKIVILQLMASLPFVAEEHNILGLSALIARSNPVLPIGSFGITASDNVYMRHTIMAMNKDEINKPVIVEAIEMMVFFINSIGKVFQEFLEGFLGFEQSLQKIEASLTIAEPEKPKKNNNASEMRKMLF
jgi:hypothetical protein